MKKSIQQYIEEGYDIDQINGIKYALEQGGDIEPYLDLQYRGYLARRALRLPIRARCGGDL